MCLMFTVQLAGPFSMYLLTGSANRLKAMRAGRCRTNLY